MAQNTLYYGDNLDILRRYIKDATVGLFYLDSPFNSKATHQFSNDHPSIEGLRRGFDCDIMIWLRISCLGRISKWEGAPGLDSRFGRVYSGSGL